MHVFKHPKYYTELRKRNKAARIPPTSSGQAAADQAISSQKTVDVGDSVRPGPGLKQQASSPKLEAASDKQQASSSKPQAASSKI